MRLAWGSHQAGFFRLTFTNRAALEMAKRVQIAHPEGARRLTTKTFHGLCAHILRVEADELGIPSDFVIYDEDDVADLLQDLTAGHRNRRELPDIMNALGETKVTAASSALTAGTDLEDLYVSSHLKPLAALYHRAMQARHALDFSDLVYWTRRAFAAFPAIGERWAARYDLVQVDEVQDTQFAEYEIVRHLARNTGNLALIGDLDQTIFEWRDAEPSTVLGAFEQDFHPTPYPLSLNHRATRVLIRAADAVASTFDERHSRCIPADHCDEGRPITFHSAPTEVHEADWILGQIQRMASAVNNFSFSRTAVLVRTNQRAGLIFRRLEGEIPCLTVEQFEFFRRQEIKDAISYLRLLQNANDGGAIRRGHAAARPRNWGGYSSGDPERWCPRRTPPFGLLAGINPSPGRPLQGSARRIPRRKDRVLRHRNNRPRPVSR